MFDDISLTLADLPQPAGPPTDVPVGHSTGLTWDPPIAAAAVAAPSPDLNAVNAMVFSLPAS